MGLLDALKDLATPTGERYRCRDCGRTFEYDPSISDPPCPYCDSADVEHRPGYSK